MTVNEIKKELCKLNEADLTTVNLIVGSLLDGINGRRVASMLSSVRNALRTIIESGFGGYEIELGDGAITFNELERAIKRHMDYLDYVYGE